MAERKYLNEAGLSRVAEYVNEKLKTVSAMPASPNENDIVLYIGSNTATYTQGNLYRFNGTDWVIADGTVTLSWNDYQALSPEAQTNGTTYFIYDAGDEDGKELAQGYLNPNDGKFYEEPTYETEISSSVDMLYVALDTNKLYRYDSTEQEYVMVGGAGGGGDYTAGFGIEITNDDTIKTADFVGTQAEWDALSAEDKAKYDFIHITNDTTDVNYSPGHSISDGTSEKTQREVLEFNGFDVTDDSVNGKTKIAEVPYTAGKGVEINNKEIAVDESIRTAFVGTQAEWNALTTEKKAEYELVNITDDAASGAQVVVDEVTEGNMNAVSSNAVAEKLNDNTISTYSLTFPWQTGGNDVILTFRKRNGIVEMTISRNVTLGVLGETQLGEIPQEFRPVSDYSKLVININELSTSTTTLTSCFLLIVRPSGSVSIYGYGQTNTIINSERGVGIYLTNTI